VRIATESNTPGLLSTAWLAPDERALTVVLVNATSDDVDARLALDAATRSELAISEVARTVFADAERAAALGALDEDGALHVPAGAIVTVALRAQ
jgi:hypothetical protein